MATCITATAETMADSTKPKLSRPESSTWSARSKSSAGRGSEPGYAPYCCSGQTASGTDLLARDQGGFQILSPTKAFWEPASSHNKRLRWHNIDISFLWDLG